MGNAFIVVWRESLEAMLVIGVLLSWIARQETPLPLARGLWAGVAAGVGLAGALGFATWAAQSEFAGAALEKFQLAMVLGAAALILHMVLWMHAHGRHMKRELERQAEQAMGAFGIAAIAALAVAREGAETVVFLYGLGMEGETTRLFSGAAAGFALAVATAWLVARGARHLNVRTLFRASEFLLLLIATALLAAGIDRLIGMEWLPPIIDPLWDTAAWLPDGRGPGRFLADFVGYRARPAATLVIAIAAFWSYALWRMGRIDRMPPSVRG
ncbi:MAG: FTR1 family iron permease [Gammaproteobacteria bacterium RIFOXYA12_FULL_61_12]|nr:MAG: FTR1 family iron permease [Gammaproteobacteria bacterium RIFOXYD12_FULL_61_37]OGT92966.1 MAG: FTR1 family iron permease [Gammaproteobacteria bacterium RIFOXYA12_FULL_61_12]